MTREQLLKIAKPMMVNLEVAKTMDSKTQSRRVIKDDLETIQEYLNWDNEDIYIGLHSKWKVEDILWVREPASVNGYNFAYIDGAQMRCDYGSDRKTVHVKIPDRFKSKISDFGYAKWIEKCQGVPNGCIKEMARTFLRVVNVRVARLQDISEQDCLAEGMPLEEKGLDVFAMWYRNLWNKTAPKGYKWEDNPYVFVYEFEKVEVSG